MFLGEKLNTVESQFYSTLKLNRLLLDVNREFLATKAKGTNYAVFCNMDTF